MRTTYVDEYIIYYDYEGWPSFESPVEFLLYSYLTDKAFKGVFIPKQGLKPQPLLKEITGEKDYEVSKEGIYLFDPCTRGISSAVSHMARTGILEQVLQPTEPPSSRWSELPLDETANPEPVQAYFDALSSDHTNSEVIFHRYRAKDIDQFETSRHEHYGVDAFMVELFRNPALRNIPPIIMGIPPVGADIPWKNDSSFHLTAVLADLLYVGHARLRRREVAEVLHLAREARASLWGREDEDEGHNGIHYLYSHGYWSSWFNGGGFTMIVTDRIRGEISCLFIAVAY